jgi:transcriptional regulator
MYNPPRFQSKDKNEVFNLMFHYPFATLISQTDSGPMVSHLPLTPIWSGNDIELVGHLATANPHSKLLDQSKVTVVFNGPHTYITPVWYAENDVPTWNYIVAHATGPVSLVVL